MVPHSLLPLAPITIRVPRRIVIDVRSEPHDNLLALSIVHGYGAYGPIERDVVVRGVGADGLLQPRSELLGCVRGECVTTTGQRCYAAVSNRMGVLLARSEDVCAAILPVVLSSRVSNNHCTGEAETLVMWGGSCCNRQEGQVCVEVYLHRVVVEELLLERDGAVGTSVHHRRQQPVVVEIEPPPASTVL